MNSRQNSTVPSQRNSGFSVRFFFFFFFAFSSEFSFLLIFLAKGGKKPTQLKADIDGKIQSSVS